MVTEMIDTYETNVRERRMDLALRIATGVATDEEQAEFDRIADALAERAHARGIAELAAERRAELDTQAAAADAERVRAEARDELTELAERRLALALKIDKLIASAGKTAEEWETVCADQQIAAQRAGLAPQPYRPGTRLDDAVLGHMHGRLSIPRPLTRRAPFVELERQIHAVATTE